MTRETRAGFPTSVLAVLSGLTLSAVTMIALFGSLRAQRVDENLKEHRAWTREVVSRLDSLLVLGAQQDSMIREELKVMRRELCRRPCVSQVQTSGRGKP